MKTGYLLFSVFLSFQSSISFADSETQIWEKLRKGGLVVLMKHASVNRGNESGNPVLRDPSCQKERNLSEKGKREAAQIGEIFTSKGINIENVLTSPYCRTTDTARIAFGRGEPVRFLSLLEALSQEHAEANTEQLSSLIGSYTGKGNLILITHTPNINAISFETVEKGSFLVLMPMGGNEFEEIGKIKPR